MKKFGGRDRAKVEEFELETISTDGEPRTHQFALRATLRAGDVVALMDAVEHEPERSMGLMASILRKVIVDDDGTPVAWDPPELPAKTKPADVVVTGPGGETCTLADTDTIEGFMAPEAGSSRRRWDLLMDPDNDEGVHLMDLVDISRWVIELSTDRPTQARVPSSRASRKTRR